MFTGIVQGLARIESLTVKPGLREFTLRFPSANTENVKIGASVAIDGCCLTVTRQDGDCLHFDVMQETLDRTKAGSYQTGHQVNFERAARFGDEIGGHLLSGHIHAQGTLIQRDEQENNLALTIELPEKWMRYVFEKGFVAIDGASLTVGEVIDNRFTVHLIPETLRITHFGQLQEGDAINIEVDSQTQTIVDTLHRMGIARS